MSRAGAGGPLIAGAAFAFAWAPCGGPTLGTILTAAGLSAQSFLKRMSVVTYSREALAAVAPKVAGLGGAEDLVAHVEAVQVRVR